MPREGSSPSSRAIVSVANRLPIQRTTTGWELAPGGLVTALRPVMQARDGVWVGWDGGSAGAPEHLPSMRIGLRPVRLSAGAVEAWTSPDIYARLPWRVEILHGLLGADVVSFHTEAYRKNFVRTCGRLLVSDGVVVRGSDLHLPGGRVVRTTAAPISIDAAAIRSTATSNETDRAVASLRGQFAGRTVLLGVDRLDYTKGIVERLLSFESLLERRSDLRGRVVLIQIAVPSRDDVLEYRDLRDTVDRLIGRINGRFTQPGGDVPVHYLFRSFPPNQLYAYYALANVLLVTPLIDGMNLVAKEFLVVQHARGGQGTLVLSEFTGAAQELREAVPCNPFDVEGLAAQLELALDIDGPDRRRALRSMAQRIHRHDVHAWLGQQLGAIEGATAGQAQDRS